MLLLSVVLSALRLLWASIRFMIRRPQLTFEILLLLFLIALTFRTTVSITSTSNSALTPIQSLSKVDTTARELSGSGKSGSKRRNRRPRTIAQVLFQKRPISEMSDLIDCAKTQTQTQKPVTVTKKGLSGPANPSTINIEKEQTSAKVIADVAGEVLSNVKDVVSPAAPFDSEIELDLSFSLPSDSITSSQDGGSGSGTLSNSGGSRMSGDLMDPSDFGDLSLAVSDGLLGGVGGKEKRSTKVTVPKVCVSHIPSITRQVQHRRLSRSVRRPLSISKARRRGGKSVCRKDSTHQTIPIKSRTLLYEPNWDRYWAQSGIMAYSSDFGSGDRVEREPVPSSSLYQQDGDVSPSFRPREVIEYSPENVIKRRRRRAPNPRDKSVSWATATDNKENEADETLNVVPTSTSLQ